MNKMINEAYTYYNEALDLVSSNNISLAKSKLIKAIRIYAKDVEILNLAGICEYYYCNFEQAYKYWSKSLYIRKDDNKARGYMDFLSSDKFENLTLKYNQSIEYMEKGNYGEAINGFEGITKEYNDLIEPYEVLLSCYIKQGDNINALKIVRKILKMDNGNIKYIKLKENLVEKTKRTNKKIEKTMVLLLALSTILILILGGSILKMKHDNKLYKKSISYINNQYDNLSTELDEK